MMIVLFIVFFSSLFRTGVTTSLLSDAIALATLRKGFLEPPTSPLGSWDESRLLSACSWRGVRCHRGRVVAVDLAGMNISSSGSLHIFGMDSLVNLSLAGNALQGGIMLSNMPSLRYLNISANQLGSQLDFNFSSMPNLEIMDAYDNNFTSSLPLGVMNLGRIRYLDLGGNFFYGRIPGSYGGMRSLEVLSLNGNDLSGRIPAELGNLTSLERLNLGYYNTFAGGIPSEIGKLKSLLHLDLSSCGLDGEIPWQLGELSSLQTLFLHSNLLSGNIPPELGNSTRLVYLDLSNNALSGEVPGELAGLQKLSLLNLFMNHLHGPVPEFVADLPDLETLQLFDNNFTGTIPEGLGSNRRLALLDLSSNKLTGTIPGDLCPSTRLKTLILFKNFLFGPIPTSLGKCCSLARVRLGANFLNGSIPPGFLYLPNLNLLELYNNFITGTLPENHNSSSSPSRLAELDLSNNMLTGSLPTSISNMSSLRSLTGANNRLSGDLPPSIGELRCLDKLDLSFNSLSGTIPLSLGKCVILTYLDLSQNSLSGAIPPEISNISVLNYLNLSRNHLNGSIPASLNIIKSLTTADLSFNNLSGRIPGPGPLSYLNASSFTGNPLLCAEQERRQPDVIHVKGMHVLVVAVLMFSLVLASVIMIRSGREDRELSHGEVWKITRFHGKVAKFTAAEVLGCVKDSNLIGRGGAGVVYRGRTGAGQEIAVKKLAIGKGRDDNGFQAEVRALGNTRHRNIVRLLAYCVERRSRGRMLVYEYMEKGSLGDALRNKGVVLGWGRRYRIAVEAAMGLCYLHHDCRPSILHRDVKSNNILLDGSWEARVADFGLAKFLHSSNCTMSAVAGSYGYIAPEYAYTLTIDEKSDVYSYGVVVLELITGRRPVGEFGDGVDIVQWAKTVTGGRGEQVVAILDPRLGSVAAEEASHLFFVAMLCVQEKSVERPTMREVVQILSEFPHHIK